MGIGQREELTCEVVALKASDDHSKELWSWDLLSVLFQLEARELGSGLMHPTSIWMSADAGREGSQLRAVPRARLAEASAAATPSSWGNECLSPKWGSWGVHLSSSSCPATPNLGFPTLHNPCFQIMIGSGWAHD